MKTIFGVTLISVLMILGVCEIWVRATQDVAAPNDRFFHPYVMTGGSFTRGWDRFRRDPRETPLAFGYLSKGMLGTYSFDYSRGVRSAAERGTFLFQDRAASAEPGSADGAERIFVLGGSVAFGVGAKSPETRWWAVLERLLQSRTGKPVHLIPAAESAHGSTQERVVLDLYVLPRNPDALIFLDGFNDVTVHYESRRPGDPLGIGLLYRRLDSPLFNFLFHLSAHSSFLRYLMGKDIRQPAAVDEAALATYASSVASVYIDNLQQMKRRCDQQKIPCHFFLQPCREVTAMRRKSEDGFKDARVLASYAEVLRRKKDVPFLHDLSGIFDSEPTKFPFYDDAHFGDEGHALLAREIARVVSPETRKN